MTLTELQRNEEITSWWAKTYRSTRFLPILMMLEEMHPLRYTDDKTRFSGDAAAHRMGQLEGYELCLERLKLATQYAAKPDELPQATWETPKIDDNDLTMQ